MWVLFAFLIAPFTAQQLEQCINEYNNLLQQCQTEINRAGAQISDVSQQLEQQTARLNQLEAEQIGLFSWQYVRRHVEYVFPEFKGVAIVPNEYWTQIAPIVDQQIRPRIAPFMATAPAEDILLFSSLVSFFLVRLVLLFASFFVATRPSKATAAKQAIGTVAASACPVSGKK